MNDETNVNGLTTGQKIRLAVIIPMAFCFGGLLGGFAVRAAIDVWLFRV